MQYRAIAGTDLKVSELCLGTMTFGSPVGRSEAIALCHAAFDAGINFIDTANSYEGYSRVVGSPGGVAETIIGEALRGRRDGIVVATKVGMQIGPDKADGGLSAAHIRREAERSLARLQLEQIDLYYLHRPDPDVPPEETVAAVQALIDDGKIAHWGVSNFSVEQVQGLLAVCDEAGWQRPVAVQPPYSLLKREAEDALLPLCENEGLSVIPYQVLQGGLLTGKYLDQPTPAGSRLDARPEWLGKLDQALLDRIRSLAADATAAHRTLLQHALLSLLEQRTVASLIIGATRRDQLDTLIAAVTDIHSP